MIPLGTRIAVYDKRADVLYCTVICGKTVLPRVDCTIYHFRYAGKTRAAYFMDLKPASDDLFDAEYVVESHLLYSARERTLR